MRADQRTPAQRKAQEGIILLIIAFVSGIGTALTGAILAAIAGGFLEPWLGFRITWWQGLLVGGLIGSAGGLFQAISINRRSRALDQSVASLGLERLSEQDTMQLGELASEVTGRDTRFWDCFFRDSDAAKIVLGDMGMEHADTGHSDSPRGESQQTCLFIEFNQFVFPDFDLQPEGLALRMLDKLAGGTDLDFEDSPRFSKKYFLSGRPRETVIKLFDRSVRDLLEQHPGFRVIARKNRMLVFRPEVTIRADRTDAFLREALTIVDALQSSGVALDPEAIKQAGVSTLAEAEHMSGLLGTMFKRRLQNQAIDPDGIRQFIEQPVPRSIPRQLRQQLKGDPFLVFMGLGFAFGGLVASIIAISVDASPGERLGFLAIAAACLLVGGLIVFLVKFFERRRMKLLTHGTVRTAVFAGVSTTAFVNGNERVFEVKFHLTDEPDQMRSTRIQGLPVAAAKELAESRQPTRVLQDADDPTRFLLIDCHAIS